MNKNALRLREATENGGHENLFFGWFYGVKSRQYFVHIQVGYKMSYTLDEVAHQAAQRHQIIIINVKITPNTTQLMAF